MVEVKFREGIARMDQTSGKWFFFKDVTLRSGAHKLVPRPLPYRVKKVLGVND